MRKSFDNEALKAVGLRLSAARGKRTQEEFAKALGISRSALANYEAGRRIPNSNVFTLIEKETGISKRQILFGDQLDDLTKAHFQIENNIIKSMKEKSPGSIPKFMISDDELVIVRGLRGLNSHSKILNLLAEELLSSVKSDAQQTPVQPYEEQFIRAIQDFARQDFYTMGVDPDRIEWMLVRDQAQLAEPTKKAKQRAKGP
jgi:transcriptional regulator with XRE-family HTH domain